MITGIITFVLNEEHLPLWKLNGLKQLSGLFKSMTIWRNISKEKQCNLEYMFNVLSMKNMNGDLCQLIIEGLDSELACMVLTEYISQKFNLVATTHLKKKNKISEIVNAGMALPETNFRLIFRTEPAAVLPKEILLYRALESLNQQDGQRIELFNALQVREHISSTYLGDFIALPHIIHAAVPEPVLIIQRVGKPASWEKPEQQVALIITVLLPAKPERPLLQATTRFTRWLLNSFNRQVLTETTDDFTCEFIIRYVMAFYQPPV